MELLGKNRIWQKNNKYLYTLPNGTYETFEKTLTVNEIKRAFQNVDYYNTYKSYVEQNGTKFGVLDRARMYPFAMLLDTWIFSNLKNNVANFIPNYDNFCTYYIYNYCHSSENGLTFNENACLDKIEFTDLAMRVRIGYSYGSFLREFYLRNYFIQYFQKTNQNINVCYSLHDDYYNAVDIILEKDGKMLGICVLDNSITSKKMKNKKDNIRHQTMGNDVIVENRNGFLKNVNKIPRMNFYTSVFGDKVEHLGEIHVPNETEIISFIKEIEKFFEN